MAGRKAALWRPSLPDVVAAVTAVIACIAFVDRPAATFAHDTFVAQRWMFDALTHVVDPVPPLSVIGLLAAAIAAAAGWRPGPASRLLILSAVAVLLTVALKDQAKYAFGRLWPETWIDDNPSFIQTGAYGFYPFHGGRGWASFPSGHTSIVVAPASIMWRVWPRVRPLVALIVALVMLGLYGADYHFVSDILAGAVLGSSCGLGVLALGGLGECGWRAVDAHAQVEPELSDRIVDA